MSKCCFFLNEIALKRSWNTWNKCRDVQCGVTRVIWRRGKVTTYQVTPWPQRLFVFFYSVNRDWLNTSNIGNDISYRLKCLFYHIFKKLSSQTMKTATSVCVIQCRIETNVGDRPCRILCPFYMLAVVLDIIHGTTQKDTGKLNHCIAVEGT